VPKRLIPLLLLIGTLLLSGACSSSSTAALTVNGTSYSQADLKEELEQLAPAFIEFGGSPAETVNGAGPGSYTSEFTLSLLNQRVQALVFQAERQKRGLEITDADRATAREVFFGSADVADTVIATFSPGFTERFIDDIASGIVVQNDIGEEEFQVWLADAMSTVDVEVNPRFGTWDPDQQTIVPPEGAVHPGEDEPTFEL
jgi:hypothetical protein